MYSQLRKKALNLRIKNNLSYTEIRKRLNVPKSTLSYWLRDFQLSEEKIKELQLQGWNKGEASRERFRSVMRKKQELKSQKIYKDQQKRLFPLSKEAFFVAGLMLYIGEGNKKDYTKLALANTDSQVIRFFIQWINEFLEIPKDKLKATLHLYENMDIKKEKEFWKKELDFHESQFYKPSIRKLKKSSFSYSESYRHGTCNLCVGGVEKKREVMMSIKALLDGICSKENKGV